MRHFLLFVFALLIPCFALWTALSAVVAVPAIGLVHTVLTHWLPDVVDGFYLQGAEGLLMTEFGESNGGLVPLQEAEYRLGFIVNTRIVSYSLPFYTALHFATPRKVYLSGYLWGLLVLYTLFVFGLLCLCLRELMVNLGAAFLEQPDVFVPDANLVGLLYQLNVLIVPTLAPALLWAWQSRDTPVFMNTFYTNGSSVALDESR